MIYVGHNVSTCTKTFLYVQFFIWYIFTQIHAKFPKIANDISTFSKLSCTLWRRILEIFPLCGVIHYGIEYVSITLSWNQHFSSVFSLDKQTVAITKIYSKAFLLKKWKQVFTKEFTTKLISRNILDDVDNF